MIIIQYAIEGAKIIKMEDNMLKKVNWQYNYANQNVHKNFSIVKFVN